LCDGTNGLWQKDWTKATILIPNIRYYVSISRFVGIYALLGAVLSGQMQCFLGKKCPITWCIFYIILNEICNFAIERKNDAFVAKMENMLLTKVLWPFLLLPKFVIVNHPNSLSLSIMLLLLQALASQATFTF
jgi:hypothetical protein